MERRHEDLNIEAVGSVKDEATGRSYTLYQKKCYHCGESFLSRKSNAMGCSHDHANSVRKHRKRNDGQPKLVFKLKLADKVDFSLKKYNEAMGAKKNPNDDGSISSEERARAKKMADFRKKADEGESEGLGMGAAPHEHYRPARNIIINYFIKTRFKKFEALQELAVDLDSKEDSKTVDVGFIDAKTGDNMVAFESVRFFSTDKLKPMELFDFGFEEVFVFNYKRNKWIRHTPENEENTSKSTILGIDLADYIDLPK